MKKALAMILALVMIFALCACGQSAAPAEAPASDAAAPAAAAKDEKTTIVFGGEAGSPFTEFYKSIAPKFEEETGIHVDFFEIDHASIHERLLTEAMAGTGSVDVYMLDQPWVAEFADLGYLVEIDDAMKAEVDDFDDFTSGALSCVEYKDKLWGLPFQYHTPILFYRTDLFEKAGLTTPPATWEELREYAIKLTDKENGIYGICIEGKAHPASTVHLLNFIMQAGGDYIEDFDSPEVREAFQYMYDLQWTDGGSPEAAAGYDNTDSETMWLEGKLAMVYGWPYFYGSSTDDSRSKIIGKFDVAMQPVGKQEAYSTWGFGLGISSASEKQDAAWEFCKWGTNVENMKEFGKIIGNPPVRTSSAELLQQDPDVDAQMKKALSVMAEAASISENVIALPQFPAIQDRLGVAISNTMSKEKTIDEELTATAADIADILSQ